jgi:hypothetical protein
MNDHDELSALEAELRRMRPRELPPTLAARLAQPPPANVATNETPASPAPVVRWAPWLWLGAGLAAALALAAVWWPAFRAGADGPAPVVAEPAPGREADPVPFKPVSAENLLLATSDEGVIELADGQTARRIRLDYLDTYTWRDEAGASLEWSVPREVYYYVPVVAY